MKKIKKCKKRVIIASTALVMALVGVFSYKNIFMSKASTQQFDTNTKYTASSIEKGTILQTFCWSFKTIKDHMADIKKAGYTSIQTSPISECIKGEKNNDTSKQFYKHWYFTYQPVSYKIGNYQLGTEEEFKEMCKTAKEYGISVIVDVVPNHMTSEWDAIDPKYQRKDYYHTNAVIEDNEWGNRRSVTQKALLTLWDVNTHSREAQNNILDYLNRCIADGASGFRYDTTKHIELPNERDNEGDFGSDFWPNISNNTSTFQYGEVLQDGEKSKDSEYAKYMNITASEHGYKIRNFLNYNYIDINEMLKRHSSVNDNKLVTWVESHDNYTDDKLVSTHIPNEKIKLGWALIAARKDSTPLFFSRPTGGGGKDNDCRFPNQSLIGDEGDTFYKDKDVAAVNIFRNEMENENEYLRYGDNDRKVLLIERGKKGVVIVNMGGENYNFNAETGIANGTYIDRAHDGNNTFKVENGRISGRLPACSVVVLYNKDNPNPTSSPSVDPSISPSDTPSTQTTVYFEKPKSWSNNMYAYVYKDTSSGIEKISDWPGVKMTKVTDTVYSIKMDNKYIGGKVLFTDGNNQIPASNQPGFEVKANGLYNTNGFKGNYK